MGLILLRQGSIPIAGIWGKGSSTDSTADGCCIQQPNNSTGFAIEQHLVWLTQIPFQWQGLGEEKRRVHQLIPQLMAAALTHALSSQTT